MLGAHTFPFRTQPQTQPHWLWAATSYPPPGGVKIPPLGPTHQQKGQTLDLPPAFPALLINKPRAAVLNQVPIRNLRRQQSLKTRKDHSQQDGRYRRLGAGSPQAYCAALLPFRQVSMLAALGLWNGKPGCLYLQKH